MYGGSVFGNGIGGLGCGKCKRSSGILTDDVIQRCFVFQDRDSERMTTSTILRANVQPAPHSLYGEIIIPLSSHRKTCFLIKGSHESKIAMSSIETDRCDAVQSAKTTPNLLVSVRNSQEAQAALNGGCDLLDIKDPSYGSLGMASVDQIAEVVGMVGSSGNSVPVSVALGELRDWTGAKSVPVLPEGLRFVKLGLAGVSQETSWQESWSAIRRKFEVKSGESLNWIAVIYADWLRVDAPAPEEVLATAGETNCAGVLIDSFEKTHGSLTQLIDQAALSAICQRVKDANLLLALAGSLRIEDLPYITSLQPDVIAVRTAACKDRLRNAEIDESAVERLKVRLRDDKPGSACPQ